MKRELNHWNKWLTCFVEVQEDGSWHLSQIPWRILFVGILAKVIEKDELQWKWVPPWRISFNKTIT